MKKTQQKITLGLVLALVLMSKVSTGEERKFFKYTHICNVATNSGAEGEFDRNDFLCIFGYPTSAMIDLILLPSQVTTHADNLSNATTQGVSSTSDRHAPSPKEYKKSLLYAVADDAVYFTADENREPSPGLRKVLDMLSADFPGTTDRERAGHIIKAHMNALKFYSEMN